MNLHHVFAEHVCPACGFQLDFMPWADTDHAAQMCPCCAIHFGYDDLIGSDRESAYVVWRRRWVEFGKRWSTDQPVAAGFDAEKQLARLNQLGGEPSKLPKPIERGLSKFVREVGIAVLCFAAVGVTAGHILRREPEAASEVQTVAYEGVTSLPNAMD